MPAEPAATLLAIGLLVPTATASVVALGRGAGGLRRARTQLVATSCLVLAAGAVGALAWAGPAAPLPDVSIVAAGAETGSGALRVEATVANHRADARQAEVRWVLAPTGSSHPWRERAYESTPAVRTLPPRGAEQMSWQVVPMVPGGLYDVVVYSRFEFDGAFHPSSAARAASPFVQAATSALLRLREPRDGAIATAEVRIGEPSPEAVPVDITVRVRADARLGPVDLQWSYVRGDADRSWWRQVDVTVGDTVPVAVDAATAPLTTVSTLRPSLPGDHLVRLRLWRHGLLLDDVVVAQPVVAGPPGDLRRQSVTGPVQIAGLDRPGPGPDALEVAVDNLTDRETAVRLFWVVAPSESNHPWADALRVGTAVVATVPAAGRARVALAGPGALEPGAELSVWVHRETAGGFVHSDGIRHADRVP